MSNLLCAVACHSETNCDLYHFSKATNICTIFSQQPKFDPSTSSTSDSDWSIGYILQHWRSSGEWTLVFQAQERIGVSVWHTWSNTSLRHDHPISRDFPRACMSQADYSQCNQHFRSSILDSWNDIKEVYLSFVKANVEVAYIVFDGTGSDELSWFSQSRILRSTWSPALDTDNNIRYFTLQGACDSSSCRRFHIHEDVTLCRYDYFYTIVVDGPRDICNQGFSNWVIQDLSTYPVFMYAPGPGPASYGVSRGSLGLDTARQADVLSVWVKFH
ncbi:hypothetical protein ElyMa_003962700 [Elysia marginata]|uniref:Apple domain-containing protein n=1 Tax=Elysia marginata TaxID=1093978 RepID=A0AAV4FVP3_9GAST|nr:hypothetical protein ElyMa_003962700 [Elysia marginata]